MHLDVVHVLNLRLVDDLDRDVGVEGDRSILLLTRGLVHHSEVSRAQLLGQIIVLLDLSLCPAYKN